MIKILAMQLNRLTIISLSTILLIISAASSATRDNNGSTSETLCEDVVGAKDTRALFADSDVDEEVSQELFSAVESKDYEKIDQLIDSGANVNIQDESGISMESVC